MLKDEIVEEIRKIREEHAKKFNYDLMAIFQDLKEEERTSNLNFVSPPPKRKVQVE